ncbi:MAG: cache domain-containing protein [Leptospiraceae bacterium]|nr:cache domain-containing protein [Leptospiraceae bacterium]MCK6382103.1 cache domain-containing protein [Leptospiraceae bacterium]
MKIREKLLIGNSIFLILVLISGSILYFSIKNIVQTYIDSSMENITNNTVSLVRTVITSSVRNHLRTVATRGKNIAEYYYSEYKKGNLSEKEAYNKVKDIFLRSNFAKIGETGYVAGVSSKGILTIHPKAEGTDASKADFMKKATAMKTGYLEYPWKNPGEESERLKAAGLEYFEPWDLIVWASSYKSEFNHFIEPSDFREEILSIKFQKSGYMYILDKNGKVIVHPFIEGQETYDSKDSKGIYFIREMLKKKNGKIIYDWKNPNENERREKIAYFKYIPEIDWLIATSIYTDEINESLTIIKTIILSTLLLTSIILVIVSIKLSSFLSQPIQNLMSSINSLKQGKLNTIVKIETKDEIGELAQNFNEMTATISKANSELKELNENLESKVEERTFQLEKAKNEIEKINEITKNINSESKLNNIFDLIFQYFDNEFSIDGTIVMLKDEEKNVLYTFNTTMPKVDKNMIEYSRKLILPLNEKEGGLLYKIFVRKKAFYMSEVDKNNIPNDIPGEMIRTLNYDCFHAIPLVIQNNPFGLMLLTSYSRKIKFAKEEIRRIENFSRHITGAIYNSLLLKKTDEAKNETENQKYETEALNKLLKSLNEDLDFSVVMKKVHSYIKSNYNINYYGLAIVDKDKESLVSIDNQMPDFVTDSDRKKSENYTTKIKNVKGAHALAFKAKRPFYAPKIRKSGMTPEELFNQEMTKMESILIIPLVLQNEPIGFLDLYNTGKMELSKDDINKLSILGEHLAGIIYSSKLFQEVNLERQKSDQLLLNILPEEVAVELKQKGQVEPNYFENATILFTDFKGFTQIAEILTPRELIKELDGCFSQFDNITERYNLEKLKTIGDSYMCAGGLPKSNKTHAIDACLASLEIRAFMNQMKDIKKSLGLPFWELRIGIHSGPVIAGVVGEKKFNYDVWGDTVNMASRMESSGATGEINISSTTHNLVNHYFECRFRGEVEAKNKGKVQMYYLDRIRPEYSQDSEGLIPNDKFKEKIKSLY